jgi:hypothetical protein
MRAAFLGRLGQGDKDGKPNPDRKRIYPAWYSFVEAAPKDGKFTTVFYVGRLTDKQLQQLQQQQPPKARTQGGLR